MDSFKSVVHLFIVTCHLGYWSHQVCSAFKINRKQGAKGNLLEILGHLNISCGINHGVDFSDCLFIFRSAQNGKQKLD